MPRASRPCSIPGCWQLTPCSTHPKPAPWTGSTRRATLPKDWNRRVALVHKRSGGRCERIENGQRCPNRADGGVDHAIHRLDHRIEALLDLCKPHHTPKTQAEAAAGRRTAKE